MATWYSEVQGQVTEHTGGKLWAIVRVNMMVGAGHAKIDECAVYRKDPRKPGAKPENVLPAIVEEARKRDFARQLKTIMGRGKRGAK